MIIWAPIMKPICCFLFSRAYLATCTCLYSLALVVFVISRLFRLSPHPHVYCLAPRPYM